MVCEHAPSAIRDYLFEKFDDWARIDLAIISVRQNRHTVEGIAEIARWISSQGVQTWLIGPFLEFKPAVDQVVTANLSKSIPELAQIASEGILERQWQLSESIATQVKGAATYLDPRDLFCLPERCQLFDELGAPLVLDSAHLTPEGSIWFVARAPFDLPGN